MQLKEIFVNGSLIGYINSVSPLIADWLNSTDKPIVNLNELDNYIYLCLGESQVLKSNENNVLNNIRTIINANNYRLSKLWDSVNFEYNPIDNYDRTETQTHNEKIVTDNRTTTNNVGARSQTTTNGSFTDTTTNENKTTAFDTEDYAKGTDKDTTTYNKGTSTDTSTVNATTDTIMQNGYEDNSSGGYTLRARGNIGTMSTQNMIIQEREVVNYNFFDELIKLFELYITKMCYESEE